MEFADDARWIWLPGEPSPRNTWVRFRRTFRCPAGIRRATLLITADSRYELFLNGNWLGSGPVRAFPWAYSYDPYDLTSWLRPDQENVLAVRVVHWGDFTFQYLRGRGGLLCDLTLELEDGSSQHCCSDETWQVCEDPGFRKQTPRICIQQGFEEHYDARPADEAWLTSEDDVSGWLRPHVLGRVGTPPWIDLAPRPVPFLTREPVFPVRVLAMELARLAPGYRWSFDLRHRLGAVDHALRSAPLGQQGRAFVTEIVATRPCSIAVSGIACYAPISIACRGERLSALPARVELREGRNLFVIAGTEWPSLLFETVEDLWFDATRLAPEGPEGCAWAYLVPFDERDDTETRILAAVEPEDLPPVPSHAVTPADNLEDMYLQVTTQTFLLPPGGFCDPCIDDPQPRERLSAPRGPLAEHVAHLLHEDARYAVLYPQEDSDLHLVVDFGRELIGSVVLDLDAAAGTVVDVVLFEGIDDSGIFWTPRLRNGFRYVCRDGHQTFRSHVRRGFRYASLTVRGAQRPVKLYNVRCLLSTYPVEERGAFTCSDALLTRIWEVGAYTVRLCMEDTYTDCPAFEQTFWVGDARNSALVNAEAYGAFDLTDHCLRLTGQSLSRRLDVLKRPHLRDRPHLTTDHVVSGWFSEIPMWTFLWIWNVWEHYQLTGDRECLETLYSAVRTCLHRCLGFITDRDLMDVPDVWNLVDWAAMDLTRDGEVTANNALLVESLRRAASMAEELSRASGDTARLQDDAASYRDAAERIRTAINRSCWSEERGAYVDTIRDEEAFARYVGRMRARGEEPEDRERFLARTRISEPTNTLVLLCGCVPPDRVPQTLALVERAREGHFVGSSPEQAPSWPPDQVVPVGSPWFLFFTLETLVQHDRLDAVLDIVREHWGGMLEKGATTFWETFPGFLPGHWSRSLCHGWSAAPAYFLSTQILGVHPIAPGYRQIRVAPRLSGLDWAKGRVPTPQGEVHVQWAREEGGLDVRVDLPADTVGELVVAEPSGRPEGLTESSGEMRWEEDGWHILLLPGRQAHYRIALE